MSIFCIFGTIMWKMNESFFKDYNQVKDYTILGESKCYMIWQFAKYANSLPGDIAELGVYRGGNTFLLALACPDSTVYALDTFTGLPEATPSVDYHKKYDFRDTSYEAVVKAGNQIANNIQYLKGFFPEDTGKFIEKKMFKLVHLDADQYTSTLEGLKFFFPKLTPGGVIILDDWEWEHCPGVKKAVEEFLEGRPEKAIQINEYQALIIKL